MVAPWVDVDDQSNNTHGDAEYAIEVATWILYKLTGEKYPGSRTVIETYYRNSAGYQCARTQSSDAAGIALVGARPGASLDLHLLSTPVVAVTDVVEGGRSLARGELEFTRHRTLRKKNRASWDLSGGVTVTYRHGMDPPTAGKLACAKLADQFILAFCGSDECRLPDRVTSISRQGVSYTVLDPQEFMKDGRTGLYEVDLFISAANPNRSKMRAKVYSPDDLRRVQN